MNLLSLLGDGICVVALRVPHIDAQQDLRLRLRQGTGRMGEELQVLACASPCLTLGDVRGN